MCKGEIGHQHIQLYTVGAAGSRYQSISDLTQPTQPMNHEIAQRPDQHIGNSTPYSLKNQSKRKNTLNTHFKNTLTVNFLILSTVQWCN